jgi:hypothetical protein
MRIQAQDLPGIGHGDKNEIYPNQSQQNNNRQAGYAFGQFKTGLDSWSHRGGRTGSNGDSVLNVRKTRCRCPDHINFAGIVLR